MRFELGPGMKCDLEVLAERRMLIQASSGGGKSRTIRRIAEQTHGKIQQIIIDPEGELVSLREKFDYVIAAGTGGDTQAHPRSAALLAQRLVELGVSAILDLYELKRGLQVEFITRFVTALMEIPKRFWHPRLIIIDEAQLFAPEGMKCESTPAVIDLATRGRKRGHCPIVATQRLSLLDKNVAAVLHNKLIGFTSLDADLKRAAFELGFDKQQMLGLRELPPMRYWGFGPALTRAPTLVDVGPHETSHPKPGSRLSAPTPPPTEKVRALLPQLADLPAEAEQRQRTEAELKKDLAQARATITRLERTAPARVETKVETKVERVEVPILSNGDAKALQEAIRGLHELYQGFSGLVDRVMEAGGVVAGIGHRIEVAVAQATGPTAPARRPLPAPRTVRTAALQPSAKAAPRRTSSHQSAPPAADNGFRPARSQQRVLDALAYLAGIGIAPAERAQLAMLADQPVTSGGYKNNLGALRSAGLINYPTPGTVALTETGRGQADASGVPTSVEEFHAQLFARLTTSQGRILEALIAEYPEDISREELADRAQQPATSGGFKNNLGALRTRGIIDYPAPGRVIARSVLFLGTR